MTLYNDTCIAISPLNDIHVALRVLFRKIIEFQEPVWIWSIVP